MKKITFFLSLIICSSCTKTIEFEDSNDSILLFNQSTYQECGNFSTIQVNELIIENNTWNAMNLSNDEFKQCIYLYEDQEQMLLGWEWQYPSGTVNAYPQLIYGWKPWHYESTTTLLPIKLDEINRLKATYEVEVQRNNGYYNLAFDNWITSSLDVNPQNIQFEFMIWEESNKLKAFGQFQEKVSTTNGIYEFYMGEPDWEPAGSNWTYLAFKRVENRQKGTVDIDELLNYLINKGIIPSDSFLASIEFGNEVGKSQGRTIVKKFEVNLE